MTIACEVLIISTYTSPITKWLIVSNISTHNFIFQIGEFHFQNRSQSKVLKPISLLSPLEPIISKIQYYIMYINNIIFM